MSAEPISVKTVSGDDGFTLIEVLFAMIIICVGALGLAMMQGTTVQANSYSDQLTHATALAQDTIERLNALNLDSMAGGGTETNIDEKGNAGGPFTRTWTVTNNSQYSRRITVTVSWDKAVAGGEPSRTRTVQISTITRGAHT
jgi:type IV pilus assembly protein PilV